MLADALDEIDSAPSPRVFVESGVLYFSVLDGADGMDADVYLDASVGLVASGARAGAGWLSMSGVDVMYGGLNLTGFSGCQLDEVRVVGARANAVDYNVLRYGTLEVCCGGSQSELVGDGLNGHFGAVLVGEGDLYAHDNHDDGFSDHEGSTSRLVGGGLVEYNGGTGLAPAYGADSVARGFISVRNQRRGTHKAAAFYVTGAPTSANPVEAGADTNAVFESCIDYESLTSFSDDFTNSGGLRPVTALCVDCKSIRPATRGFNVRKIIDCGYIGSATSSPRNPATLVETAAPIA